MLALYGPLVALVFVLALPVLLALAPFLPRVRGGASERLTPPPAAPRPGVWVHAASVGEAEAAAPLVRALLERGVSCSGTTLTLTGRERLRSRCPGLPVRLAPLDLPGLVHVSVRRVQPRALVLVETELWPGLIGAASAQGARVVVVSGRISDRSFPRYRRARPLVSRVLERVHAVGARSEEDAERFLTLGLPRERLRITGDLKLDRPAPPPADAALRQALGPGPLLVGGSTHAGEEEALLGAWAALREAAAPELRLVLAPRRPARAREVERTCRRHGARAGLRSAGAGSADVVVVDSVGELAAIYGLAELVFVGGTLAPVGGHNLFEPVQSGKVVVHGPHLENQRSQAALLAPHGVLHAVADARELREVLGKLWSDPERHAPAQRAAPALALHRGALARTLELVMEAYAAPAGGSR